MVDCYTFGTLSRFASFAAEYPEAAAVVAKADRVLARVRSTQERVERGDLLFPRSWPNTKRTSAPAGQKRGWASTTGSPSKRRR